MKLYRTVLSEAWQYTHQHPSLWVLGFFVAMLTGTAGELDRYFSYMTALVSQGDVLNPISWTQGRWFVVLANLLERLQDGDMAVWLFVLLVTVAALVVGSMIVIAHGGLIHAAANPAEAHFDTAFAVGWHHFASVAILDVITYLAIGPVLLAFSSMIVRSGIGDSISATQTFIFVMSCFIFLPYILIVSLVSKYAAHAIVLQNQHLGQALRFGWKLFFKHWLVSVEMAIVVLVVGTVGGTILIVVSAVSVAPYFMTALTKATVGQTVLSQIYEALFIFTLVYLISLVVFASIYTTWQSAAWTRLYQRLLNEKPTGKLLRVLGGK